MKTLKKVSSGLIAYNNFSTDTLTEPFRNNYSGSIEEGKLVITGGSVTLDAFLYDKLVLDVKNSYISTNTTDMGGVSINRANERRELFEYYRQDDSTAVPYIRLVKNGDVYTGFGSEDGVIWTDTGYVYFTGADSINVTVVGSTPYPIASLKAYKSPHITLFSMLPGWRAEAKSGNTVLGGGVTSTGILHLLLPYYPFSGEIKVYDEDDNVVGSSVLSEVWGGDEYVCSIDVDLVTMEDVPLTYSSVNHLGHLVGTIEQKYKAKNNTAEDVNVTIRVAEYSEFIEWVFVAIDSDGEPGNYETDITFSIPSHGEQVFWVRIMRPDEFNLNNFNFRANECNFFLEVM